MSRQDTCVGNSNSKPISRRTALQTLGVSATVAALAGCISGDDNNGMDTISMASPMTSAELPTVYAEEVGIAEDLDLSIEFERQDSAADAVPQLATGNYDVATGATNAAIINSINDGLDVLTVADGARIPGETPDGLQYHVSPEIYEEDATFGEMVEGMTIGLNGSDNNAEFFLARTLASYGLSFDDVEIENIPFPQQVSALDGGSIDAAQMVTEVAGQARAEGIAEFVEYVGRAQPAYGVSVVMFGNEFLSDRRDAARRFLEAYLEGLREMYETGYYTDEVQTMAEEVLDTPPQAFQAGVPPLIHQNGEPGRQSVMEQAEFYHCTGAIDEIPDESEIFDTDILDEAIENIGEVDDPLFGADWYEGLDGGPEGLPIPDPEDFDPPENEGCGGANFLA